MKLDNLQFRYKNKPVTIVHIYETVLGKRIVESKAHKVYWLLDLTPVSLEAKQLYAKYRILG